MSNIKLSIIIVLGIIMHACQIKDKTKDVEQEQNKKIKIYLIGDSTCANKAENKYPENGWGMKLNKFFNENVEIENHALNGRSSKSFRDEGKWEEPILNKLNAGDYVFIQFGHNDQKFKSPDRYTNPFTGYKANLERYVNDVRTKGGNPILLSSIVRRNFNEYGTLIDTHGEYPLVVKLVANEMNVPFVDLQRMTEELVIELGVEESKRLYLHLTPGEHPNYKNGVEDNTHLNEKGAEKVAEMLVKDLKRQNILVNYLAN